MHLNLENRQVDTVSIEPAISWREKLLLSLFTHVVIFLAVLLVPDLPFIKEAEDRRAERLAEISELQLQANRDEKNEQERPFIFVQPRVDFETKDQPRPDAALSDKDRIAEALLRILESDNQLPISEGNSQEFVITDSPSEVIGLLDVPDLENSDELSEETDEEKLADATINQGETFTEESGTKHSDMDKINEESVDIALDDLFRRDLPSLRSSVRRETFRNPEGDTGRFGPDIQFDTKGVEFGPWIRRFVAQIRRNWFWPYAIWSEHGNVVVTFNVQKDGALTDLTVIRPAKIEAFTNSAANALRSSNPTQPLPQEYPDDHAFFTVTFYFNESPPL